VRIVWSPVPVTQRRPVETSATDADVNDVPVTVVLACGCRRFYSGTCPWSAVQQICRLHGDIFDVVWIERVPGG
jgi:hypothetical protein